eukprot:GHVO01031362.1.p1 GENE.GHVO01031362.1~~GHVO01031362.1.p1  ORF type:complete len:128 (+),score=3.67 GHVO01031362.1:598-981(+)
MSDYTDTLSLDKRVRMDKFFQPTATMTLGPACDGTDEEEPTVTVKVECSPDAEKHDLKLTLYAAKPSILILGYVYYITASSIKQSLLKPSQKEESVKQKMWTLNPKCRRKTANLNQNLHLNQGRVSL